MIKTLTREKSSIYHYVDGNRVVGAHDRIRGNVSGIWGDVSSISGNIDDCGLTEEDRKARVHVSDLIAEGSTEHDA